MRDHRPYGFAAAHCAFDDAKLAMNHLQRAFADYARLMQKEYGRACIRDPGLAEAVWLARETDPSVGWLDVAAARERCQ